MAASENEEKYLEKILHDVLFSTKEKDINRFLDALDPTDKDHKHLVDAISNIVADKTPSCNKNSISAFLESYVRDKKKYNYLKQKMIEINNKFSNSEGFKDNEIWMEVFSNSNCKTFWIIYGYSIRASLNPQYRKDEYKYDNNDVTFESEYNAINYGYLTNPHTIRQEYKKYSGMMCPITPRSGKPKKQKHYINETARQAQRIIKHYLLTSNDNIYFAGKKHRVVETIRVHYSSLSAGGMGL